MAGFAKEILQERTDRGTKKHMFYIVSEFDDYDLISFMDNTVIWESTKILYRYTIMIESCALVLLFFVAKYIAKKIVDPLEETYKKQKQFISDAEHELKTPVSIASANAEILKREIGDNQWLTNIQYENDRMTKLIEQLLELARTENNKAPMHRVEFSRLTAGVVLPFEGLMFEKRIALKLDISEEIYVEGNSIQLSQLVSGLLDNAISYGKEDGEIVVSLHENRTMAILTVINDGEPIAMEHRKHLFERFYRTDESRNGENNHYGLGLPIAKAIVVSHRGKIEMACKDQKIIFTVKLPKYK